MTGRTKLTLAGIGGAGALGAWLGYTRAAVFGPGWTPQLLAGLERQAKRAARQGRPASALRSPTARGACLKNRSSARSNRAGGTS